MKFLVGGSVQLHFTSDKESYKRCKMIFFLPRLLSPPLWLSPPLPPSCCMVATPTLPTPAASPTPTLSPPQSRRLAHILLNINNYWLCTMGGRLSYFGKNMKNKCHTEWDNCLWHYTKIFICRNFDLYNLNICKERKFHWRNIPFCHRDLCWLN